MKTTMAIAGLALLAGCTAQSGPMARQSDDEWALQNAAPVGEPQDCIQTSRIRQSEVRNAATIDFRMIDGKIMRNRLPHECTGLAFQDQFTYETTMGRLCSIDTITILNNGGVPGPTCGLGTFQEVKIAPR